MLKHLKKIRPDFHKPIFFNEEKTVKASLVYGFTPELLDVRKQVIDKVDNYFAKLVFPFDSDEFKRNFYILMCQPKWRTSQKSFSAIQANLNGLSKYPEEFAVSQKPGDRSRYPVVTIVPNESEGNLFAVKEAFKPVQLLE